MVQGMVLVVEDEPSLLLGIQEILKLEHYHVLTAANGRQALRVLEGLNENQLPDLILSDIMMPVMDGFEFLAEVRLRREWVGIPFVFLTAKGEKSDVQKGRVVGVDDYLVKPFDAKELIEAINARLERQRAIQEIHAGEIDDVKKNIITILNHEFRTPLTLIVAYADMLRESETSRMNDEDLVLFLREVNVGAERIRRLVENFILLAELQTGASKRFFEYRKHTIPNFSEIIRAVHTQIFGGGRVQHSCLLNVPATLPPILGNPEYLVVILRELLLNAIKFSSPDRPIRLEAEVIAKELHIRVIDGGRGIASEELPRIWDAFYQIDRDYYEDQGAGSGLAIAQGLAELHGARIEVESEVDQGSCFTLVLPIMAEAIRP